MLADWTSRAANDRLIAAKLPYVRTAADAIVARLSSEHVVLHRWQIERYAQAQGRDVAQTEAVYTLSADGAAIADAADLPDPAWPFDAPELRAGRVRGAYTWYDAEPATVDAYPYVIRCTRPYAGTPAPGDDIGTVAWTQEPAYRPAGE